MGNIKMGDNIYGVITEVGQEVSNNVIIYKYHFEFEPDSSGEMYSKDSFEVDESLDQTWDYIVKNLDNETIDFPSGVTSVGSGAFRNCTSLQSVDLSNLTSLYGTAFRGCSNLKSVKVSSKLVNVDGDLGGQPFEDSGVEDIDFTDMTVIPGPLFAYCYNLKYVDLSNIETISSSAFYVSTGSGDNYDSDGYFITKVKCNNEVIKKQLDNWPDLFNRIVTLVYDGVPYIYVKHKDKWLIIRGYNIDDVKDDEAYIPIKDQTIWRYIKLLSEMDTSATPIYIKSNNKWLRISF